jgi:hypothetical protein
MRFYYSTYLKLNNYSEAKNENSKLKKKRKKVGGMEMKELALLV